MCSNDFCWVMVTLCAHLLICWVMETSLDESSLVRHTHLLSFNVGIIGELTLSLSLHIITFAFVKHRELSAFVFSCLKSRETILNPSPFFAAHRNLRKNEYPFLSDDVVIRCFFYTNMFILMNSNVFRHRLFRSKV